jgi:hypothetical protein
MGTNKHCELSLKFPNFLFIGHYAQRHGDKQTFEVSVKSPNGFVVKVILLENSPLNMTVQIKIK